MSSAAKKVIPGNSSRSIYDIIESCVLSEEDELELKRYVESRDMLFIMAAENSADVDEYVDLAIVKSC